MKNKLFFSCLSICISIQVHAQGALKLELKSENYTLGKLISSTERMEQEKKEGMVNVLITDEKVVIEGDYSDKCLVKEIHHDKAERLYDILCEDGRKMYYDYYVRDYKYFGIEYEPVENKHTKYLSFRIK